MCVKKLLVTGCYLFLNSILDTKEKAPVGFSTGAFLVAINLNIDFPYGGEVPSTTRMTAIRIMLFIRFKIFSFCFIFKSFVETKLHKKIGIMSN